MAEFGNGEIVGGLVTAILSIGWWVRKQKPGMAMDDKMVAAANADVSIIGRLQGECKRLGEQNDKLAVSLNQFQLQLMDFQTENSKLSRENSALREENLSLREEIMELRIEVQKMTAAMLQMQISNNEKCSECKFVVKVGDKS
jgi:predicted nuclease with TOPRIM domain